MAKLHTVRNLKPTILIGMQQNVNRLNTCSQKMKTTTFLTERTKKNYKTIPAEGIEK